MLNILSLGYKKDAFDDEDNFKIKIQIGNIRCISGNVIHKIIFHYFPFQIGLSRPLGNCERRISDGYSCKLLISST